MNRTLRWEQRDEMGEEREDEGEGKREGIKVEIPAGVRAQKAWWRIQMSEVSGFTANLR